MIQTDLIMRLHAEFGGDYSISHPNVAFTPPSPAHYLDVDFFENQTNTYSQDPNGVDHRQGIFQVGVVWSIGGGFEQPTELANEIIAHFTKGLRVGDAVISSTPWVGSQITEQHKVTFPVSIEWHS